MKWLKDLKVVLILVLIGIVAITQFKSCNPEPPKPIHIIDTLYQKVREEVPVYVPKWRTKIKVETKTDTVKLPAKIDTSSVVEDYYAKYKTIDTLKLTYTDSAGRKKNFGQGVVTDIISQNRIIERGVIWDYSIPTVRHTIIIPEALRNQLYVGVASGFNKTNFVDNVSGGFLLKTKKQKVYQLSLGLGNRGGTISPFIGAGIYWKIQIKKPKVTDLIGN